MRATEIIRGVLDLIDQLDNSSNSIKKEIEIDKIKTGQDTNRFRQIIDLITSERTGTYDNSPNQVVAGVEAVTSHAGGGWNGPKNPADLRTDSVSIYPNHQHRSE